MSWLVFLDESGHDKRTVPYEVHGGIAVHAAQLWPLIVAVRAEERKCFGALLHQYGTELKGSRLLAKDRFLWASQGPAMDNTTRRRHALSFLNNSHQGRAPRRDEFTAFGQASLAMVRGVFRLLRKYQARLFAAVIPRVFRPLPPPEELLRKDMVFLLERVFYFLEERKEMGLLVMDGTEKQADLRLVRQMERYFVQSCTGRERTSRIVPAPLFVESDMSYGVQVADLCIYCLNWAWRSPAMLEPVRPELCPLVHELQALVWHGAGQRQGHAFRTHGLVFVPDPYTTR